MNGKFPAEVLLFFIQSSHQNICCSSSAFFSLSFFQSVLSVPSAKGHENMKHEKSPVPFEIITL